METTQILLVIEFAVLAGAIISWFVRQRANRKSPPAVEPILRYPKNSPQELAQKRLRRALESRASTKASGTSPDDELTIDDAEPKFRIPWGWPHYQEYRATRVDPLTPSEAMNSFVDCLVREKNLVAAKRTDPRINTILNALLEERRVPVSAQRPSLAEVQNRVRGRVHRTR